MSGDKNMSSGAHVVGGLSLQISVQGPLVHSGSFINIFPSNLHRKQCISLFSCILKFCVVLTKQYDINVI